MQSMFTALLELLEKPLPSGGGVKTDNSILLVYPPEKELDFREHLIKGVGELPEFVFSQPHRPRRIVFLA